MSVARSLSSLAGLSALWFGFTLVAPACKSDKPPETGYQAAQGYGTATGYGTAPGQVPPGYGTAPQPTSTVPGAQPTAFPTTTVPPGSTAAPTTAPTTAPSGNSAQPVDASAVSPILNQIAAQHIVAGAKPIGGVLAGQFQAGQTLEAQIQLQPQKCYTVVATALPPVTELNVEIDLATVLPNLSPVLAVDSDTGTTAVVGKKPNCYKWALPLPTPAKVVLKVASGSGLAAAQVYEK